MFFDPQYRDVLDKLKYGNEGVSRQKGRCALPQMTSAFIDTCIREFARVLKPSAYLMLWTDAFHLCEGDHLRIADVLKCVDRIAWGNLRMGQGNRTRHRGTDLLVLQKRPLNAKDTWPRSPPIEDRWPEKIDFKAYPREVYPHTKPIGLITRLISVLTKPGDLVVDPAAGSFVVLHAAHALRRNFVGCDLGAIA